MNGVQDVYSQIVAPLAALVVTAVLYWRTRRFLARALRAPGKIARVTEEHTEQWRGEGNGSETVTTYIAHVEFAPANGPTIEFNSPSLNDRPSVGAPITVAYDAADPAGTAKMADGVVWRPTVIAGIVTFGLLMFSFFSIVVGC